MIVDVAFPALASLALLKSSPRPVCREETSEAGFSGFYDLAGLEDLHHGTVPILIIPES
jgi:hypothetical protein